MAMKLTGCARMPINIHNAANEFIGDAEIERRHTVDSSMRNQRRQKFENFIDKRHAREVEEKKKVITDARDSFNRTTNTAIRTVDRGVKNLFTKRKGAEKYNYESRQNAAIKRMNRFHR